jgi:hypothetical protein
MVARHLRNAIAAQSSHDLVPLRVPIFQGRKVQTAIDCMDPIATGEGPPGIIQQVEHPAVAAAGDHAQALILQPCVEDVFPLYLQ